MPKKKSAGAKTSMAKTSMAKAWTDPDDAPELTAEYFARADLYRGNTLVQRGRPKAENPKQAIKLRLDPDVIAHFRRGGDGWQTRINAALRKVARLSAGARRRVKR